jgi:hypothetical protein
MVADLKPPSHPTPDPTHQEAAMRPHRPTKPTVRRACALAATLCILFALAAQAGAMPPENVGPNQPPARDVATPTVVKETIVRPTAGIPAKVFVLAGAGVIVAMLGAGYLGACMPRHTGR